MSFLTFLVNSTFHKSILLDLFKHAAVTPVIKCKNEDFEAYKNYRPVSDFFLLCLVFLKGSD